MERNAKRLAEARTSSPAIPVVPSPAPAAAAPAPTSESGKKVEAAADGSSDEALLN
jgi:hypothetical protein